MKKNKEGNQSSLDNVDIGKRRFMVSSAAFTGTVKLIGISGIAASTTQVLGSEPDDSEAIEEFDVVVVGSGAAGSTAAIFAHEAGAKVLMLDKGGHYGGTSAKSGGNFWIANHQELRSRGVVDDKQDFLKYLVRTAFPEKYKASNKTLGIDKSTYELLETFYDKGSVMISELGRLKALNTFLFEFEGHSLPDYYEHLPENKVPEGRILASVPEVTGSMAGDEMMSQFSNAVHRRGVDVRLRNKVTALIQDEDGKIIGVQASDSKGKTYLVKAKKGVVFASGGYAHNKELVQRFQRDPIFGACAAPSSTGDFIGMATRIGAKLGSTFSAWRGQVVFEETFESISVPTDIWYVLADGMFFVNKYGLRCVNEGRSYHDRTKTMYDWDPAKAEYPNLFHFMIYDQRTAETSAGIMPFPLEPDGKKYVIRGEDLEDLAKKIDERLARLEKYTGGVRLDTQFSENLNETFKRFNRFANNGKDEDFGRGDTNLEQYIFSGKGSPKAPWKPSKLPNPALYPLQETGPYYAIILAPGVLDTNGGPVVNSNAQVLDARGEPIPGLFGAGNCIASPANDSYWAAGATLGLAMTFGMIAGQSAAASEVLV